MSNVPSTMGRFSDADLEDAVKNGLEEMKRRQAAGQSVGQAMGQAATPSTHPAPPSPTASREAPTVYSIQLSEAAALTYVANELAAVRVELQKWNEVAALLLKMAVRVAQQGDDRK